MSRWDSFMSSISTAGSVVKKITGGGAYLNEDEKKREEAFTANVQKQISSLNEKLDMNPAGRLGKEVTKVTADLLLKAATEFNDKVYSPVISRPISTAALLADTQSPLYKKGQYEEGFQFSDIKKAYARSAKVSAQRALTKSDLIPLIGSVSSVVLSTGEIDTDKVDLWDDENIKQNFSDNAVGRWFTGIGDFIVGTKGITAAGKLTKVASKSVAKPLGLYTKGKSVDALATDMENGILYTTSNGFSGSKTVSGSHVTLLAGSKDWGIIEDIVTKYSSNEKLIPMIHEASDANVVKDILLADKGNIAALERLAGANSHLLFDMADVPTQLRNKFLQTGEVYIPEGAAVPRLKKAFDDAIASNPQFKKLRDAFFDEDYSLTPGGKAYMPLEPTFGAGALIKAQETLRGVKTAIRGREYEKIAALPGRIPGVRAFAQTKIGETVGGVIMQGVRLVGRGTEALPTGFVSFSGMRPLQARVELNGFLNNLELFRDGSRIIDTAPGVKEKVSVVRKRLEDEYMKTLGQSEIAQVNALKSIDSQVGRMLAYSFKKFDEREIEGYLSRFQMNTSKGIQSVKENGFGIGIDGNVILTDPQTIRQLAESYRFTPWDDIETQLAIEAAKGGKKVGRMVTRETRDIFSELNKLWTFDVLARPSYAFKQSLFEPMISASLSQGISFVRREIMAKASQRAGKNFYNWNRDILKRKITNRFEYKAVASNVDDKSVALQEAIAIKNTAEATVNELLTTASPATKSQHLSAAQKELAAANKIVDKIELDLRDALVPYGVTEAIPSMATLQRRIAYLEANPGKGGNAKAVASAKAAIKNYQRTIAKLATNKKVIIAADDAVQDAYNTIDKAVKELGEARVKQADVFGKSAEFKKRYYSDEKHAIIVNGQQVHIDSFIQESSTGANKNFTSAVRAETQNARTSDINFLGELSTNTLGSSIRRKVPLSKIGVDDPLYFDELAHIANRQYRGDPLMDLIFADAPIKQIQKWASSEAGRSYLRNFDVFDAKEVAPYISDKISLVRRMYPSVEARNAILKGEVTSQQLEKYLAPYLDELYDIVPSNHNYVASNFGVGAVTKVTEGFNNFTAKTFSKLASVENPVRAALFEKMAIENVARKAAYLQEQGIAMTTNRLNALRQAAGREALEEMEKTLYTINNPNRFVNSLRAVTAFPGANVNAFMRYGRLAAKNPVRATGFLSNYGRAYMTFGVDENGNPTEDINKITHLVIPGTKELGRGPEGEGILLGAQSLGFLINRPGPSFVTSLSMGKIMEAFPQSEDEIEDFMTIGGTNWYKIYYPYGAPTSVTNVFRPPWLNAAINAFNGPEGKKDYLSSWKSVFNYHAMLVEMGIEDDMPSDEEIRSEVKSLWRAKFFSTFASPYAGIPYKVDANPMGLTSTLYYKLQEKYKAQGLKGQDARDAAGDELISLLGPGFMIDRVSFTGSSKNVNMPATYEAYERVFKDNDDLVTRLSNIEPGEIGLVGLLTADLSYDPAEQSNNILNILANPNTKLPGSSKSLNELKMTPQEIEVERMKQRTWNQYTAIKEALEAKITDGRTLRAHPELKVVLEDFAKNTLKEQSQAWYDEYELSASGDTSYKYARALNEIVSDSNFMKKSGNSAFWQDAEEFVKARTMFSNMYQAFPDYDPRKALFKDAYNNWIAENIGQWDANLKTIITRHFDNDSLKVVG